jgi:hypothetical protein
VAVVAFALFLGALSLLFHLRESTDQVYVAVQHVFEPEESPEEPTSAEKDAPPKEAAAESEADAQSVLLPVAERDRHAETERKPETEPAQSAVNEPVPESVQEAVHEPAREPAPEAVEEAVQQAAEERAQEQVMPTGSPTETAAVQEPEPGPEGPAQPRAEADAASHAESSQEATVEPDNKAGSETEPGPKEPRVADADPELRPEEPKAPKADPKPLTQVASLESSETPAQLPQWTESPEAQPQLRVPLSHGMETLARTASEEPPAPRVSESLGELGRKIQQAATSQAPAAHPSSLGKGQAGAPELGADPQNRSVTVAPKEYLALFRAWQTSGKTGGDSPSRIPLRVENLRETYPLFQMKPVALAPGKGFFDLDDGVRITEAALGNYCATVFRVRRPWEEWGPALRRAGVREGDRVEVRYYMYGFMRDAIYRRVETAYRACRDTGALPANTAADQVDVLGRAYAIQRKGGGRFGVLIPVSLDAPGGRMIPIDPSCFGDAPDVRLLRSAGLI